MSGNLFIVSAPSGAGKSSLVAGLLKADDKIKLSVSYTTRAPRAGELNGREYYFISKEKFEAMIAAGEFLESALVHGNYYGTSKAWIAEQRAAGSERSSLQERTAIHDSPFDWLDQRRHAVAIASAPSADRRRRSGLRGRHWRQPGNYAEGRRPRRCGNEPASCSCCCPGPSGIP